MSAELLLEAVLEALTLPDDAPGYSERIEDRAAIAKVVIRAALTEGPAEYGWNADWLRQRMREEEAQHRAGESGD